MAYVEFTDQYNQFLQRTSGLNKRIAENTPMGSGVQPSAILEVNARFPRQMSSEIMHQRRLLYVNLGTNMITEGFDRVIPCENPGDLQEGLDTVGYKEHVDELKLGTVVIAHQSEWITEHILSECMVTSVLKLPDDGSVYLIDEKGWHGKDELVRFGIEAVKQELGKHVEVTREAIVPVISLRLGYKVVDKSDLEQVREIMDAVNSGKRNMVNICVLPLHKSIEQPFNAKGAVLDKGKKVIMWNFADEVIAVRKLSDRIVRSRQEAKKKKKRNMKTQKKKKKKKKR